MGSGCGIHPPGHTPLSVPYSHTVIFLLSGGPTPQHHLAPLLWATFHANWTSVQCAFSSACLRRHFSFSAPTQFSNNTTRIFCPPIPLTARQEVWLVTSITSILGIPTTLTSQLLLHASHGALKQSPREQVAALGLPCQSTLCAERGGGSPRGRQGLGGPQEASIRKTAFAANLPLISSPQPDPNFPTDLTILV